MGPIAFSKDVARGESELRLPDSMQLDAEAKKRLEDGIEIAEGLLNPHLVPIHRDEGSGGRLRLHQSDGGGESLEQWVRRGGSLTTDQTLEVTAQLAEAVASLHRAEQPHGAVIAQHVRLTSQGAVQLAGSGAYELFRQQPPRVFADLYADQQVGYQEAGRKADLQGLVLILLYGLFGAGEKDRSFQAFADRLRMPREGAAMLRRLLGRLNAPLRLFLVERLEADDSRLLEEQAAARLVAELRSLKSGEVDLRGLWMASPAASLVEPRHESPSQVKREAALAVAALLLLISLLYFPPLLWFWLADSPDVPHRKQQAAADLLTLPGKNGTWWAEDPHTFWLLPPLREAMIEAGENVHQRVTPESSAQVDIYQALDRWFHAWNPGAEGDASPERFRAKLGDPLSESLQRWGPVIGHLDPSNTRPDALLAALDRIPGDDATTLHVKAILRHRYALSIPAGHPSKKLAPEPQEKAVSRTCWAMTAPCGCSARCNEGDKPKTEGADPFKLASEAYRTALNGYRQHAWHRLELMALCHADYAELLMARGNIDEAADHFKLAIRLIERRSTDATAESSQHSPLAVPFLVNCYCKESLCYRSQGHWTRALLSAKSAQALCKSDGVPKSIAAYQFERAAWLHMDLWDFRTANQYFQEARQLRGDPSHFPKLECSKSLCETRLRDLHNVHGIAMTLRYLDPDPQRVQESYQEIVKQLENRRDFPTEKMQVFEREQYDDRLLNSLQRLADSHVYAPDLIGNGRSPAVRLAAKDALRDMLHKVRRLAVLDPRGKDYEARLLGQLALLHGADGDLEAARRDLRKAQTALRQMDANNRSTFLLEVVEAYLACRECPVASNDAQTPDSADSVAGLLEELKVKVTAAVRERTFGRDELDIVQIVCRLMAQEMIQQVSDTPAAPVCVAENARTLAFLLHKLILTPRQQQVNAGIVNASAEGPVPMRSYFSDAYRDIIRLVSAEFSQDNARLLDLMRMDDTELDAILLKSRASTNVPMVSGGS